jgi:hypothetical protein
MPPTKGDLLTRINHQNANMVARVQAVKKLQIDSLSELAIIANSAVMHERLRKAAAERIEELTKEVPKLQPDS